MDVIYIAGSYRSDCENGVFENIIRARNAAVKLWQQGYAVVCPHLNSAFMGGICDDKAFLEGDLAILRRCDCIYLLKGWELSQGARAEHELAVKIGLEIMYESG
jgi:hypothetical protein